MIYILHDNKKWLVELKKHLEENKLEYKEWFIDDESNVLENLDLSGVPPEGVYYNRVSASSHTRGARFSLENSRALVEWLESHNRRIVNGSGTFNLETSKISQYLALKRVGVKTPKTYIATNKNAIIKLCENKFGNNCIIKDNRSGSGIGVKRVTSREDLVEYLCSTSYVAPIDGITLVQEYIESPEKYITRVELIGGEYIYSVRVDTGGGFNLCPADECNLKTKSKFTIIKESPHPELVAKYSELAKNNNLDLCGIEYIVDGEGNTYTYDINCNTNYNSKAEESAGLKNLAVNKITELFKSVDK